VFIRTAALVFLAASGAHAGDYFFQGDGTTPPLPPAFVNSAVSAGTGTSVASVAVTLNPVTAGNLLVISVRPICNDAGCTTIPSGASSVTDLNSNTCSLVSGTRPPSLDLTSEIWACPNINTSTTTNDIITVHFSPAQFYPTVVVSQWSGMNPSPVDDSVANNDGTNSTTSSVSVTTLASIQNNDLLYAVTILGGSGFTTQPPFGWTPLADCVSGAAAACDAYLAPSSAGSQTALFQLVGGFTASWSASIAGFKAP
jgi:hypothetical protein